ncbi:MAG: hypothetical protein LBQ35_00865 [Spirochaetaceae bacterium]|jgi:hypothetical protein|nr:hypothetical protein [Spirochaetaceae bacterium]
MRYSSRQRLSGGGLLWAFAFLVWAAAPLEAQFFRPFTSFSVIRTEHFEIIFPAEAGETARSLAGFADAMYGRVSAMLGIEVQGRIPVAVTPHTGLHNSVEFHLPYPHIIIFDTAMDLEWTAFPNSLENLFLHELVHAVSLSSKKPFFRSLSRIFGGWVYPAALNSPLFMVEGVAVSMESLDETGGERAAHSNGRAGDPLYREYLFQMILDGAFLSPFEASGVYDYPPWGNSYYWYGGYFSAWLQQNYGMARYAQLWQAMGGFHPPSIFFLRAGFYRHFKDVYGRPFADAWKEFRQSLWIDGVIDPGEPLYRGPRNNRKILIKALASGGGRVFFLDRLSGRVFRYDPATGESRAAFNTDTTAYHLALREDGGAALVSSYRYEGTSRFRARAVVTEYRSGGGRTGRNWERLYYASYFRDGVVGIAARGHRNDIVFIRGNGRGETREVLLRGNAELLYAGPVALDERRIIFIAAKAGRRELCLYDYEEREIYTLATDLPEDRDYWRYLRGLGISEGRIFFSYNHDGRMYKLGAAELNPDYPAGGEAGSVSFAGENYSGGVFLPVQAGGHVYYRGAFSPWDALMRYPAAPEGTRAALRLIPWEGDYRAAALPGAALAGAALAEAALAEAALPVSAPAQSAPEQPRETGRYFGLGYLNPLKLWLPLPLIRQTGPSFGLSLDGAGIFSYMADPIEENRIMLSASLDVRSLTGAFSLDWTNYRFGFPLTLSLSDDLDKTTSRWPGTIRASAASLSAALRSGLGGEALWLNIVPRAQVQLFALDPGDGSHPYSWKYAAPLFAFSTGLELSSLRRYGWEQFGSGLSLALQGIGAFRSGERFFPRFEAILQAALEPRFFPLRLRLYGAWDRNRMNLSGASPVYSSSFSGIAASEYAFPGTAILEWLAGGEAELGLFSLDIQKSLSHLYFNRFSGALAYRGALYHDPLDLIIRENALGGGYHLAQSLVARLSLSLSSTVIPVQPFTLAFTGLAILRLSILGEGLSLDDFVFGLAYSLSY